MSFARPSQAPDWADTVGGRMSDPDLSAREAFMFALDHVPLWLKAAMLLRNTVVAPFGLRTSLSGKGHFLTRMPIVADTPTHFETGMIDKHLTFTIAVRKQGNRIGVTTAVWFNSLLGKFYLRAVMPGHILATRQIAGRIANPLSRHRGEYLEGNPS